MIVGFTKSASRFQILITPQLNLDVKFEQFEMRCGVMNRKTVTSSYFGCICKILQYSPFHKLTDSILDGNTVDTDATK